MTVAFVGLIPVFLCSLIQCLPAVTTVLNTNVSVVSQWSIRDTCPLVRPLVSNPLHSAEDEEHFPLVPQSKSRVQWSNMLQLP